ncbi:MAG: hypothetical protein ACFNTC_01360 [Prevotella sp.]
MKKKVYRARMQFVFEGVFDVVAENKEKARQKVLQDCDLVMGGVFTALCPMRREIRNLIFIRIKG